MARIVVGLVLSFLIGALWRYFTPPPLVQLSFQAHSSCWR
jgi:hypothetical protein